MHQPKQRELQKKGKGGSGEATPKKGVGPKEAGTSGMQTTPKEKGSVELVARKDTPLGKSPKKQEKPKDPRVSEHGRCCHDHKNYSEGKEGTYIRYDQSGYRSYVEKSDRCKMCRARYNSFNERLHPVVCKSFSDDDIKCRHSLCSTCYGNELALLLGSRGRKRKKRDCMNM